ncbi:hypothetical protein HN385_07820 [archaeon]|jgi:hypothetical protein|nr:hypothetical protein [archaeon]
MDLKKITKIEVKKNYIIETYKKPPNVIKYVRKTIVDKNGFHNIATFAIVKDPDKGTKTVMTSFWRPINKPSAKRLLKYYLKNYPKKVKFATEELKKEYLTENLNTNTNRSIISTFFEITNIDIGVTSAWNYE